MAMPYSYIGQRRCHSCSRSLGSQHAGDSHKPGGLYAHSVLQSCYCILYQYYLACCLHSAKPTDVEQHDLYSGKVLEESGALSCQRDLLNFYSTTFNLNIQATRRQLQYVKICMLSWFFNYMNSGPFA